MNKNIGDMSESDLKDFIIELQEENSRNERKIERLEEVIDKAIKLIDYYGITPEENDNMTLRHILKDLKDILKEVE